MATVAVLVDGVGRTREMRLRYPVNCVHVPRPKALSALLLQPEDLLPHLGIDDAEFRSLGNLPDGRWVYGFRFSEGKQYELWHVNASWRQSLDDRGVREVSYQVERQINALNPCAPVVVLFDQTRQNSTELLLTRDVMGVARKSE